jgi:hypothetical protein
MGRRYKTPSRRRLKKWRSRVERLAYANIGRRGFAHWFNELLNCTPMIDAAKHARVNLLDRLPKPEPRPYEEVRDMLYAMMFGRPILMEDWPTRENLEI